MSAIHHTRGVSLLAAVLWALPALAAPHVGIEVGAKGVKAVAVEAGDGGLKILSVETINTSLVADLAAKKEFSAKGLDDTAAAVAKLAKKLREEHKVADGRTYVVASSGLFAPLEGDKQLTKANQDRLADAIRKASDLPLEFVSVDREAALTITSVVPARLLADAILLDVGSGNTKGGAVRKGGEAVTFGIPFGTVSFADQVKKGEKAVTAARLREELVAPKLREALKGKDEFRERKRVYLSGGTVWALATFVKPGDREDLTELAPNDLTAFSKLLAADGGELPNPDLTHITDAETRRRASEELAQVRKTFSREQLVAGAELLTTLTDELRLSEADKRLCFARKAYVGWLLGYVAEKSRAAK